MIGFLRGKVYSRTAGKVLLDVGGVGYELFMPERDLLQIPETGGEVLVHVHTAFRDDSISLFGFVNEERRRLFLLLLEVSGVGPKLAMNVLAESSSQDLLGALARGETATLQSIHGVGKKTAARLCVDLRDRAVKLLEEKGLSGEDTESVSEAESCGGSIQPDAVSALVNLGWRAADAEKAVAAIFRESPDITDLQQLLTRAMSRLSTL